MTTETMAELDKLQLGVRSDSDAAYRLWKMRQEAEAGTTHCCDRCDLADEQEAQAVLADIDTVLAEPLTPTFDHDWATAPRSMTTGADRSLAAYFWHKGRMAGHAEGLMQSNVDLREMMRAAKEVLR
jgi:hypothetical protein